MLLFRLNAYAFWRARIIAKISAALSLEGLASTGVLATAGSSSSKSLDVAGAGLAAGASSSISAVAGAAAVVVPAGADTPAGRKY